VLSLTYIPAKDHRKESILTNYLESKSMFIFYNDCSKGKFSDPFFTYSPWQLNTFGSREIVSSSKIFIHPIRIGEKLL
jgi:hypothetical protein